RRQVQPHREARLVLAHAGGLVADDGALVHNRIEMTLVLNVVRARQQVRYRAPGKLLTLVAQDRRTARVELEHAQAAVKDGEADRQRLQHRVAEARLRLQLLRENVVRSERGKLRPEDRQQVTLVRQQGARLQPEQYGSAARPERQHDRRPPAALADRGGERLVKPGGVIVKVGELNAGGVSAIRSERQPDLFNKRRGRALARRRRRHVGCGLRG